MVVALLLTTTTCGFIALYDPVTNWLHGDDFYRALMSVEWWHGSEVHADHYGCGWCEGQGLSMLEHRGPFIYPGDMSWLPFQFYVYGLAVPLVQGNLHFGLTAVSQLLGTLSVLMLYLLARELYGPRVATVVATLLALTSWHAVISLSCLAEPLYYALALASLWMLMRWLRSGRSVELAVLTALLMLLSMTRNEAWLLIGLAQLAVASRLYRRVGRSRRGHLLAWAALLLPAVLPVMWCWQSWLVHGHVLNYYQVNRGWFDQAMGDWSLRWRLLTYPCALYDISHVVCVGFLVAILAGRWTLNRRNGLVILFGAIHLAILIGLFILGSAPLFVERIVLLHFALMLPVVSALIVRCLDRAGPMVRVVAAAGLILYGGEQFQRAASIFDSGDFCDHPQVREPYARLGEFLRQRRGHITGAVVVDTDDRDHLISIFASLPGRVRSLNAGEESPVLEERGVEIFCVPMQELGRNWSHGIAEARFLDLNSPAMWHVYELESWRIYTMHQRTD